MASSRGAVVARTDLRRHRRRVAAALAAATGAVASASICTRRWREERLSELTPAVESGAFFVVPGGARGEEEQGDWRGAGGGAEARKRYGGATGAVYDVTSSSDESPSKRGAKAGKRTRRDLRELSTTVARAGLMGTSVPDAKSVATELSAIRKWHQDRGFLGGLVLRELNRPLFDADADGGEEVEGGDDVEPIPRHELDRRECYYLYYEVRPDGEIRQQIFCRGTTLAADVRTCLAANLAHDEELGCRLHAGFRNHADRLVTDVEPLLVPPQPSSWRDRRRRVTVELCGHSLGGAAAFIAALKLQRRGHNVVRVTSVGAPRFCESDDATRRVLAQWLPPDALRIENDLDAVTYLPPFGRSLGDKLWFVDGDGGTGMRRGEDSARRTKGAYFVPSETAMEDSSWWVDSLWVNTRIPEMVVHVDSVHRVPSYVANIEHLAKDMDGLVRKRQSKG